MVSCRQLKRDRRGTAMVECAVVMPVAVLLIFSTLDLGLMTLRHNLLSEACLRIGRECAIRGSMGERVGATWGPTTFEGTAADGSNIVAPVEGLLATMNNADVSVRVEWPAGSNDPHDPVHVEVTYEHNPLVPLLSVWGPVSLRGESTISIVN